MNIDNLTFSELKSLEAKLEAEIKRESFAKFCAYNFRDVDGIVQLNDKFSFIELANQMAHENTVGFSAVLGTVAYVETGIINHAHNVLKRIVHDKVVKDNDQVEGAIVLDPKVGLHEWVGAVDLKSLYPNTLRSLNGSPEMIIGQFDEFEVAWAQIFNKTEQRLGLTFETGKSEFKSASEWNEFLRKNNWAVSAYGTVFDQSRGRGVVADILGFWYSERKRLQAETKKWGKEVARLKSESGIDLTDSEDDQQKINSGDFVFLEGRLYTPEEHKKLTEAIHNEFHYDLLQLTKKISL
jgi:DNA polymerase elongation subunit (family B)